MQRLQTALSWKGNWTGTHDPEAIRVRRAYLRERDPRDVVALSSRVRKARDGRLQLAGELAWPIRDELEMVNDALVTSHPLDLVDLADVPGDDMLVVQQRFEALCLVDLAVMMHELERIDPFCRVEDDLRFMIHLLERRIFLGGTRDLLVYTYHDPSDMYRVNNVSYGSPRASVLDERKHVSRCRMIKDGLIVRFDTRPKDTFRSVLKLIRQIAAPPKAGRDPYVVKDRCAFRFVVQDVGQARALADELSWHLTAVGADVQDGGDNLTVETGTAADATNLRSSSRYRKKQLDVYWRGRSYEFQIVLFAGYYSAKYSLDEENHVIYKLRQGVNDVLPMLFPPRIYLRETTWTSKELLDLLYERQLENLGWNLRSIQGSSR